MKLKEALAPDWKKIAIAFVILFLLFLIPRAQVVTVDYTSSVRGIPFAFYSVGTPNVPMPPGVETNPQVDFIFWAFFLNLVICYGVAASVVYMLTKKKKQV